ncbi:MAG: carboxypeptidase regulatory-like domain-containing protein [Nitrospirae bacterium]|nr:carboxypeptidase regulatory-like domain-containing protein [Nitrospirota bacterium]
MKKYLLAVAVSLVLMLGFTGLVFAHEVVEVKDGATIKGVVKVKGAIPQDEAVAIDTNKDVCGKEQKMNKFIASDSGIKNAVVFIDNPGKGKSLPKESIVNLTLKKCAAEPLVSIGFVGGKFVFKNEDPLLHTLQLKLWLEYQRKVSARPLKEGATIYNIALPNKDTHIEKPIKFYHRYHPDTGFIRVTSNTHTWMRGYVFIFDHPYAVVTDEKGAFVLDNLLPGEYVLKVWHEGFGMQERKIKVAQGEVSEIKVELGN